jgi:hypothetical protein
MFFGILIKMNWGDTGKHNTPRFHAEYQDYEGSFNLDGEMIVGNIPRKQEALIRAWALLHGDELSANWKLAGQMTETFRIDPLK